MSDELQKMAIADIRPGTPVENDEGYQLYDYSHLLPHGYDDIYKIIVSHKPGFRAFMAHVAKKESHPLDILNSSHGRVEAEHDQDFGRSAVRIHYAQLKHHMRGAGVGSALYEACMAHAKHNLGCTHVVGDIHSSLAHATHKRLSAKHGMTYDAEPNIIPPPEGTKPEAMKYPDKKTWDNSPNEPFDDKYKEYQYELKSEMSMAKSLSVKHLDHLTKLVQGSLTDDLRKPQYRGKENCLAGHCYVASEALYHLLGGQKSGWVPHSIQHEGGPHWYLKHKHSGAILDPTASQFESPVPYDQGRGRGFLTKIPSKRTQTVLDRVANGGHAPMAKSEEPWTGPKVACSIAIFNSEGHLLMGLRSDSKKWTLPGGKMDEGETPEACARREVLEEAGLEIKRLEFLGKGAGGLKGDWKIYSFKAKCDDKPDSSGDPDKECEEWEWIDVRTGLPEEIARNLHNRDNDVTLQLLGLQPGSANMSPDLSKSLKHAFIGAVAAAGVAMAGDNHHSKWTPHGLHEDLHPIAHLESSFGKRTNHAPHSKGAYHTAYGAVGMKAVTGHEEYKRTPWLQKTFPNLHDPVKFTSEFQNNPALYNHVASAHWGRLKKLFGGDRMKAAYAWRWGPSAAMKEAPEHQAADPYVTAYQKLWNTKRLDQLASVMKNPLSKSEVESWLAHKSETMAKAWKSKDGITIPAHGTAERRKYDKHFESALQSTFGSGVGKTLKPVKVKLDQITDGQNLAVVKDRLHLYHRMARHDKLPPIVVRKAPTGNYFVVDGNHRWAAAKAANLSHIDAFEMSDEKPTVTKTILPKHLKLYNIGDDPDGHMNPVVRQTKHGQFFEPVEWGDVEKKLKKLGYHGYHGHNVRDPHEFTTFPGVKVQKPKTTA